MSVANGHRAPSTSSNALNGHYEGNRVGMANGNDARNVGVSPVPPPKPPRLYIPLEEQLRPTTYTSYFVQWYEK